MAYNFDRHPYLPRPRDYVVDFELISICLGLGGICRGFHHIIGPVVGKTDNSDNTPRLSGATSGRLVLGWPIINAMLPLSSP